MFSSFKRALLNFDNEDKSEIEVLLKNLRHQTSIEQNPKIQEIIDAGLVPILIQIGSEKMISDQAQLNLLWTLTNICSGTSEQTKIVVDSRGLDLFYRFCDNNNFEIAAQALWGIGNIAGDNIQYRDILLNLGCLKKISEICSTQQIPPTHLSTIVWVVSNLVRGKPLAPYEYTKDAIPILLESLAVGLQQDLITCSYLPDCLWGFSYISENDASHELLLQKHLIESLKQLIKIQNLNILVPVIRTIGNIVAGTDDAVNKIINCDIVPLLLNVFFLAEKKVIKKEVAWTLSNIAAGNIKQANYLLQLDEFNDFINKILDRQITIPSDVFSEVSWIIANLTSFADEKITSLLIEKQWDLKWYTLFRENFENQNEVNLKQKSIFLEAFKNIFELYPGKLYKHKEIIEFVKHLKKKNNREMNEELSEEIESEENGQEMISEHSNLCDQEVAMVNEGIENLKITDNSGAGAEAEAMED